MNRNHIFNRVRAALFGFGLTIALGASAQSSESGYFTDGYLYRYQLNPAIGNTQNFFSSPTLGNVNFSVSGTFGVQDVLYKRGGRTVLFLNPEVSTDDALAGFRGRNHLNMRFNEGLFSTGFKGFGGYNTLSINFRTDVATSLPGELFCLLKEGVENKSYDLSDVNLHLTSWAEVALGHSHQINEWIRVGGALKVLVGMADIKADFKHANLNLQRDKWIIETEGELSMAMPGISYETSVNDDTKRSYVSGVDFDSDKLGVGGYGLAVDLGMTLKINDDWTISAALTDLGFIRWKNNVVASTNGLQQVVTSDYTFNVDADASNSFDNECDRLNDQLSLLYQLNDNGDTGATARMLGATFRVGAQYSVPGYRRLTFGALSTTYIRGIYSRTDLRLSANVAPCRIFSAGFSCGMGLYGPSLGWILNFHPNIFSLFLASDSTPTRLAKQGYPLTSNASFRFGINVPF